MENNIYYKATIYHNQHDVIVEEYTEPDAIGQLNRVYQFIDEQKRCGEYCVSDTPNNAIQGLIDYYDKNIKSSEKKIKEWRKKWKEILKHIK